MNDHRLSSGMNIPSKELRMNVKLESLKLEFNDSWLKGCDDKIQ